MNKCIIEPDPRVRIRLDAVCHDCGCRHRVDEDPRGFTASAWEWEQKHRGHDFEFLSTHRQLPKGLDERRYHTQEAVPWWLEYRENADIKIAYAAAVQLTETIHSTPLASSSTFTVGHETAAVDNTSNKYLDYRVSGKITTGTSPTATKEIRIYAYSNWDDTPTYPDVIDGTASDETLTSADILNAFGFLGSTSTTSTSNQTYYFSALRTIVKAFGFVPKYWGLFIAHNTGVALNATDGNHALYQSAMYVTST